jgi:GAF domain-containing protein
MHGAEAGSLSAQGRLGLLGVACLRRSAGGSASLPADVALAEAIASRGAMALDNVRLYDEARATSVALQRSLLPKRPTNGSPASRPPTGTCPDVGTWA